MKFIDLFAGVGGFRLALDSLGHQCVFSSEINSSCQRVYETNFGEKPFGDITQIAPSDIPDFDILAGGFPCQPFSLCGKKEGFEDVALRFSISSSASNKGNLGWINSKSLSEEIIVTFAPAFVICFAYVAIRSSAS